MAGEAIRAGFAAKLAEIGEQARQTNAKPATVYYRISELYGYDLTHDELRLVAARLGYQPGWAWYKLQEQPAQRDTWLAMKEQAAAAAKDRRTNEGWSDNWQDFMRGDPFERFKRQQWQQQRQQRTNEEMRREQWTGFKQRTSSLPPDVVAAINLLGLKPGFTEAELKAAYRKYVMKHHPDRGGTAEKFQAGTTANDLLQHHAIKESEEVPF